MLTWRFGTDSSAGSDLRPVLNARAGVDGAARLRFASTGSSCCRWGLPARSGHVVADLLSSNQVMLAVLWLAVVGFMRCGTIR